MRSEKGRVVGTDGAGPRVVGEVGPRNRLYIPARGAQPLAAYGRKDFFEFALSELQKEAPHDETQAMIAMDRQSLRLGDVFDQASDAVWHAKRPQIDSVLQDLDAVRTIPDAITHLPRAAYFLGYLDGANTAQAALALADSVHGETLAGFRYAEQLLKAGLEEATTQWSIEWGAVLRDRPWLRRNARWPQVRLVDINGPQPWWLVG